MKHRTGRLIQSTSDERHIPWTLDSKYDPPKNLIYYDELHRLRHQGVVSFDKERWPKLPLLLFGDLKERTLAYKIGGIDIQLIVWCW